MGQEVCIISCLYFGTIYTFVVDADAFAEWLKFYNHKIFPDKNIFAEKDFFEQIQANAIKDYLGVFEIMGVNQFYIVDDLALVKSYKVISCL